MSSLTAPQIKSRANLGCIYSSLVSILLRTFCLWVLSTTVGTQVLITTFESTPIADTAVPLVTGLIGPLVSFSNLFLFNGRVTVSCIVILEVTGIEVPETPKFGQLNVLDLSCISTDGFVEVNNFGV